MPAAMICSVMANIVRDEDKRPEPWTPADFMPGAKTEEDEMREFAEAVARGDSFETDPALIADWKTKMQATFGNIVEAPRARR